jgi:hypothetical protein
VYTQEERAMRTLKSIGAILAGFITVVVLSVGTDAVLVSAGFFPPSREGMFETRLLVMMFIYQSVYTMIGGAVTALLAPGRPIGHAMILGCAGIASTTLGTIMARNPLPTWYPIALVIGALPCAWLGARLVMNRKPKLMTESR